MRQNKLMWLGILFICLITVMIVLSIANLGGGYFWYTYVIIVIGLTGAVKSIIELSK